MLNYQIMFVLFASFWFAFFPSSKIAQMFSLVGGISGIANSSSSSKLRMYVFMHICSPQRDEGIHCFWSLAFRWIPWYLSSPELHPVFYLGYKCGFAIKQRHSNCNHIPPQHKMSLSLLHVLTVSTQYRAE